MPEGEDEKKEDHRLRCKNCGGQYFRTIWVRHRKKGKVRSLECRNKHCKRRTITYEKEVEENE